PRTFTRRSSRAYLRPWREAFLGKTELDRGRCGAGLAATEYRLGTRRRVRKSGRGGASAAHRPAACRGCPPCRTSRTACGTGRRRSRCHKACRAGARLAARCRLRSARLVRTRGVSPAHARQFPRRSTLLAKTLFLPYRRRLASERPRRREPASRCSHPPFPPGTKIRAPREDLSCSKRRKWLEITRNGGPRQDQARRLSRPDKLQTPRQ